MKSFKATDFKAGCLALLDEVARSGETITITKRGKPVAQLIPVRPANLRYPQDGLRGTVQILGDIVSPVLDPDNWEVERLRGGSR
jgi:prevent-host-death family protein